MNWISDTRTSTLAQTHHTERVRDSGKKYLVWYIDAVQCIVHASLAQSTYIIECLIYVFFRSFKFYYQKNPSNDKN